MFKYTNIILLSTNDDNNMFYVVNYLVKEGSATRQISSKTAVGTFAQLLTEYFSAEAQRFIGTQRWLLAVPTKYVEDFKTLAKLAKVSIDVIDIDVIEGILTAFTMLEGSEF